MESHLCDCDNCNHTNCRVLLICATTTHSRFHRGYLRLGMAEVALGQMSKVYPNGARALSNLDLTIGDGEFMVLVGPSGCGKTTAMRIVAGLEEISEGELKIDGRPVNLVEPRKRD